MQKFLIGLVAVLALAGGIAIYLLLPQPQAKALVYEPPRIIAPFNLTGDDGAALQNQALEGQWTLLFTGYTFCPDICPTTMAQLKKILPELQQHTEAPVKVWMISVDPQRDTVQRLADYAGFFGEEFYGVRAEHPQLYPFVQGLGLMYSIPDVDETDYLVNHSAAIILVNPDGNLQAIFKTDHQPGQIPTVNMKDLVSDFSLIAD
ncbi:photosynthetic protein synthase I [Pseudidiomarina salinarum]|uniref:Photosynthetic protein synthase I n=1 Tax=Pseudidiomarina salinarum TaxID=435908 RepID=A0A094JEV3_9GAMM|nr:SCO family protein [Pseudidiomarina salinarum]KFZ31101.1 photosynthetic protein synthase I [Pseudidiomarina salinarum]RUO71184.1 SCO family protein [Pseudidiomarina salinarum]